MKKLGEIVNVLTMVIFVAVLWGADIGAGIDNPYAADYALSTSDIRLRELESGPVVMLGPPGGRAGISTGDVEVTVPPDMEERRGQAPQARQTASPEFRQNFTAYHIDLIQQEYRAAYNNCVIFLFFESGWEDVFQIDERIVEIAPFRQVFPNQAHCSTIDGQAYALEEDVEYLYFLIGDVQAPGQHYAGLVVDALTDLVVGFIPTDSMPKQ